jgi:hypothetical protein
MMYAEVLSEWTGDGLTRATAFRPKITVDYPQSQVVYQCEDVTGQPAPNLTPEPNLVVVAITCDAALLAVIDADNRYEILWSEER